MEIGAILAVMAMLGTVFSAVFNTVQQHDTNKLQEKLANQANIWQEQNRDYENWYNSPAGLQSRGLNPALAMSAAGAGLAQSASAGAANLPSDLKAPQIPDFGQSLAGANQVANQQRLTDSQVKLNEAQANRLNTQSEIDWKNLTETQKRTLIMQQNADTYKDDVLNKFKDIENKILDRNRRFELDKDMQEFTKHATSEVINQSWEQLHINEENFKMSLELLPFMKKEAQARINELGARAAKETNDAKIAEYNAEIKSVLSKCYTDFENEYRAYQSGEWSAGAAEYRMIQGQSINQAELAEHPVIYWLYQVASGNVGSNAVQQVRTIKQSIASAAAL